MKLLFVDGCIRGEASRTKELCDFYVEGMKKIYPDMEVQYLNLMNEDLRPMLKKDLVKRDELLAQEKTDDEFFRYANDFAKADYILIGAPYWNLTLPSLVKVYLEWVCIGGITFDYRENYPFGMCKAKEMMLISTAGFDLRNNNNGIDLLRQLADEFFGIEHFRCYVAERLDAETYDADKLMARAKEDLAIVLEEKKYFRG